MIEKIIIGIITVLIIYAIAFALVFIYECMYNMILMTKYKIKTALFTSRIRRKIMRFIRNKKYKYFNKS